MSLPFAITRTEIRGKTVSDGGHAADHLPPFILSLSMIFLFGRQGLITKGLFGITTANVYGMHSLIVVQTISFFSDCIYDPDGHFKRH